MNYWVEMLGVLANTCRSHIQVRNTIIAVCFTYSFLFVEKSRCFLFAIVGDLKIQDCNVQIA